MGKRAVYDTRHILSIHGASEQSILVSQGNLAITYANLGRPGQALRVRQEVYSGWLKLEGEEQRDTLIAAGNYAISLHDLRRFHEAKAILRKTIPMFRRVLGDSHELTFQVRWIYARALYKDSGATLDNVREAVTTLEDAGRIARRVFGGAHPLTVDIEGELRDARAALRARETPNA